MLRKYALLGSLLIALVANTVIAQDSGVNTLDPALDKATSDVVVRDDSGFNMGWIGLAGLLGLAGLMPRDRHDRVAGTSHTTTR